jgi:uncharacterized protein YprB with RNaseH-like and TPR domain
MRACCFDLETSGLNGNFGIILCACVKPFDGEVTTFRGDSYKDWKNNRVNDYEISRDIYKMLQKFDIWIAHNGVNFDVPFLRTRLMKKGKRMIQPKVVDPVRLARRYLRLGYNSLEAVAAHFGISGKTHVLGDIWMKTYLNGDSKALDYIVKHCVADVKILEMYRWELSLGETGIFLSVCRLVRQNAVEIRKRK